MKISLELDSFEDLENIFNGTDKQTLKNAINKKLALKQELINALKSYLDELDSLELEQFRKELDELFKEASDRLRKEKQ